MSSLRPWVARLLEWNNREILPLDADKPNPRPVSGEPWYEALVAAHPRIRAEWDRFTAAGGQLPLIEDALGEPDQNQGSYWRMTTFVNLGRGVPAVAHTFPEAIRAMGQVPGLRSASWSVLGPGGWIPEHVGENGGCLRLLVAVDADDATLQVSGVEQRFRDGEAALFDDTQPHAVRNDSDRPRVVILGDLLRPLPGLLGWRNRLVQRTLHTMTPAYRNAAARGGELFTSMNADLVDS